MQLETKSNVAHLLLKNTVTSALLSLLILKSNIFLSCGYHSRCINCHLGITDIYNFTLCFLIIIVEDYYLGFKCKNGQWFWQDRQTLIPMRYNNWGEDQPDHGCGACGKMGYFSSGEWNDYYCTYKYYAICEYHLTQN